MAFLPAMDTSMGPRDQGLPTAWPMKGRHIHNNGFSTLFFKRVGIFSSHTHPLETDFFPPPPPSRFIFYYHFSLSPSHFECLSDEDFPTEKIPKSRVNAWFLLYVWFFFFLNLSLSFVVLHCVVYVCICSVLILSPSPNPLVVSFLSRCYEMKISMLSLTLWRRRRKKKKMLLAPCIVF